MSEIIKKLIKKSAELIRTDDSTERSAVSGRFPHYPMIFFFNSSFPEEDVAEIKDEMGRLWPYSAERELYYKYCFKEKSDEPVFYSLPVQSDKLDLSVSNIVSAINSKAAEESFASGHADMTQWNVFNIVETESEESVEAFKANCLLDSIITGESNILKTENLNKILIVLLHNPPYENNNNVKEKIKYLSGDELYIGNSYDAVVIFSDLKNDNTIMNRDAIIRLISDIVVTINHNDENFKNRYSNNFKPLPESDAFLYLVSFVSLEKPIKRIICEMATLLLEAAKDKANEKESETQISAELNRYFDGINLDYEDDSRWLEMLPLKEITTEPIIEKSYYQISSLLADKTILDIICEDIIRSRNVDKYVSEIIRQIGNLYSLTDLQKNPGVMKKVLNGLSDFQREPSDELILPEFFSNKLNQKLKNKIINLLFKKIDNNEISNEAGKTIESLNNISKELQKEYIQTENDLEQYINITKKYINDNINEIKKICALGNSTEEVLDCLTDCIKKIIEADDYFRSSFIDEYEVRANRTGDIYEDIKVRIKNKKIARREAEGYELNNVCFTIAGSYVQKPSLEIYFLKTNDQNNTETALYKTIKEDSNDFNNVQYINTKSEDSVRVLTFYKIQPSDLHSG